MLFKPGTLIYAFEVEREGEQDVMYVNYLGAPFVPNIADSAEVMARVVEYLERTPNISRVVFVQQRNYSYDYSQVLFLQELADLDTYLLKQEKILSPNKLSFNNPYELARRYEFMSYMLNFLKSDPLVCYSDLKNEIISQKSSLEKLDEKARYDKSVYLKTLENFYHLLENSKLIKAFGKNLQDYVRGDRSLYAGIFRPDVIPNFTFTRLAAQIPRGAEIISQYDIGAGYDVSTVTILKRPEEVKYFYHVMPPEYSLDEGHHLLLNMARNVLIEHQPKAEEFTDPERVRQVFFNVARDLLQELGDSQKVKISYSDLNKLAAILVRHTIGFGLIEVLLQDKDLQDIVLNAPITQNPIFLRHAKFDECYTNILPSQEDADSWAAKFRMISGRPLDEANPILDTDLSIGEIRARIAVIQQPLSPSGLAYAIRRHRESPWTLPLFIKNKMLNSFAAGLFSFLVDGSRTILVAGTRSSGKCVDGNTLIQLSDGSLIKIKNLVGEKKRDIDDGIITNTSIKDSYAPSLLGMNLSSKKITDVWKRTSPEKVVKIRTKSGKEIITTKEHPYFVYNRRLTNLRADELKIGDLIASPRQLKINEHNPEIFIELKDRSQIISETGDFFILKGKTNSSTVKFPKKLTSELAEFVGLVIGDGHIDSTQLTFFNNCKELREKYISLLKIFEVPYRVFNSRTTKVVQVCSRVLSKTLSKVFEIPLGNKSNKIIIPSIILKSNNNILAAFLRGYFDTDGYCPAGKRDLEPATASKIMSEHLKLALLRFGVIAFTKPRKIKGVEYYRILIRGEFASRFLKEIGFSHPFKKQRAELIISKSFLENTNVDIIPQGNKLVKELRMRFRASPQQHRESGKDYWAYENNQYRVSRRWFKKIVDFYNERYSKILAYKNSAESLRRLSLFKLKDYISKIRQLKNLLEVSYTSIANSSGLSERGVRKILQNQQVGNLESLNKISSSISSLQSLSVARNCPEAVQLVEELSTSRLMVSSFGAGMALLELRNFFNISNEEFASSGISLATVTNLFTGKYIPSFVVIQLMAKKAVEIYDSCLSQETQNLLLEAQQLANSDIFWDEIICAEEINKIDDFVYDLTVEDTHNFVANGLIAHNTSLLGALMLEIMSKYRIITVEDTPELAVDTMRKLRYDILRMKVRSALLQTTSEVAADEGIRTSLRLGDSCLIVGEVRSQEAKALYEAMRVGALANVVAGTIHGASPYGVFDRVVNDLGVPITSFKATDCIIVANPVKTADGMHSIKRVMGLTEVRKHWTKDPEEEKGFVDLLNYNVERDVLEPTDDLINGESEIIKNIAGGVRGWAGNWDAVYDNILLRGRIKEELVKLSDKLQKPELLEAGFVTLNNSMFHQISDKVRQEVGLPVGERVFPEWQKWTINAAKKI